MATLDFEKLAQQGVQPKEVLDFIKGTEHNFNLEALSKYYKDNGFNEEQTERALYYDLSNMQGFSFKSPQEALKEQARPIFNTPNTPTQQKNTPLSAPSTPLSTPPKSFEQKLGEIELEAKELEKQDPNFFKRGLGEFLENFNYLDKAESARRADYTELINKALEANVPYAKLPSNVKTFLAEKRQRETGTLDLFLHPIDTLKPPGESEYKAQAIRQSILKVKDPKELTDAQKSQIYKDRNLWTTLSNSLFLKPQQDLEEYQELLESRQIASKASRDITLLNNIDAHKSFFSLFKASDPKEKERYENAVKNVLQAAGFEGAAFKDGHIYGTKGDKTYRINENFFDNFQTHILSNAGTLAGSIVGAAQGATRGIPGAIIGGAIGAGLGAGLDHALSNYTLNREQNFSDMARHMIEQGSLNVVGDALFLGGAKAIATLGKHAHSITRGASALAGYIPGIGMAQRFLNGNVKAAQEVLAEVYTPEQEQALKEFAKNFGGELSIDAKSTPLAQKVKNAFGEDSKTYKAYQTIEDIFRLSKQSEQQEAFIRAIRADDSGTLLAFMSEAANSSPRAHNTLKGILNKTTRNLEAQLEQLHLNPADIKAIFEDLDKGTRQSYAEATQRIIPEVLEGFKTTLEPSKVKNIYKELEEQGFMLEARPFLKHIENNIYNPEGVSFTQLNNALKTLNSHAKHASNPGLKDYIRNTTQNIFRHDIKEGIDDLFSQLPEEIGKKYQELYHTTLKDYATMKETLKMVDGGGLKLRDAKRSEAKALEGLLKYAQGQGEAGLDNLTRLSKGLSPQNREVLELNMLDRLFKSSLFENDGLRVFDSQAFFKRLETLKEGTFSSQASKDFIDIASGFNRLFNQDAKIAAALKANTGEQVGSSIATSVSGAVQYQVTKAIFAIVVRTMFHIPFAKSINSKVSQAALRYHIKAALNKSVSVGDFKQHLRALGQRVEFDNATKALIREIEGGLPPDDGGGGGGALPSPKDTPISGGGNKPPNDEHMGKEGNGELISKTTPTRKATKEDLTEEFLEEVKRRKNDKVWVGDLTNPKIIEHLGFDSSKPIKMLFDGDALTHIEKRHGEGSNLVEISKQPAVKLEDIQNYPDIVNHADLMRVGKDKGRTVLIVGKQINGYMVVVEIVGKKYNLLSLKTIYKENGKLENGLAFKDGAGIRLSTDNDSR
ncbi:PBECR3 domain-containing polyvalent protein [Helicobacter felis]|uniref:PBECR3 domain-containing polyvalent protein n=1 Tax=Helicobacter felis TaxID=214 RepID=UPI001F2D1834|nr:hypothetical protein [Helicobacter felis]